MELSKQVDAVLVLCRVLEKQTEEKLSNYLNSSKSVPAALNALRDSVDALEEHLKSLLEKSIAHADTFDSRGSWRICLMMATRLINASRASVSNIPDISQDESTNTRIWRTYAKRKQLPAVLEETDRINTLVKAMSLMLLVNNHADVVTAEDVEHQLTNRVFISPFWWKFDSDTLRFHDMLNLLKATVAETYKKETFIARLYSAAAQSVSLLLSSNQHLAKESHRAGSAAASIEYLRTLWNFAESGVPNLVVSLVKPSIRVSESFRVPCDPEEQLPFGHVKLLVVSANVLPFRIPENMLFVSVSSSKTASQPTTQVPLPPIPLRRVPSPVISEPSPLLSTANYLFSSSPERLFPMFGGDVSPDDSLSSSPLETHDGFVLLPQTSKNTRLPNEQELPVEQLSLDPLLFDHQSPFPLPQPAITHVSKETNFLEVPIIMHIHGGGFISGSPSTHETYLRDWAKATDAVVFSVDYTKSPEVVFPFALKQCFFFYKWLVSGKNQFGIRPRPFVLAGDSAGGNLALAVLFQAMLENLQMPDAVFLFYPALDVSKALTPSRILFAHDCLLPFFFLKVVLDAYTGGEERAELPQYLLSPLHAPDELLRRLPDRLFIFSAAFDPLLDDATRFLRRLDQLNKPYKYFVFELPHGWLNFTNAIRRAYKALDRVIQELVSIFPSAGHHKSDSATSDPTTSHADVSTPISDEIPNQQPPQSLLARVSSVLAPLARYRSSEESTSSSSGT